VERERFVDAFRTEDSQIGVKSFLEHGPGKAEFTGRVVRAAGRARGQERLRSPLRTLWPDEAWLPSGSSIVTVNVG
jgi:hypothetical protein